MYKQNSEYKQIQKKLVAAVAMVLVACIMVVSSSYAWFTLSTAPEVTGITTSVGSNGNLEMALRTGALGDILDAVGGENTVESNITWGNLVDLSDSSYHLDSVALAPARLNITIDEANTRYSQTTHTDILSDTELKVGDTYAGETIYSITSTTQEGNQYKQTFVTRAVVQAAYKLAGDAYLQTPVYGVDGRLESLDTASVINGLYNEDANGFAESVGKYGVRAVGTISNLTPEEMALRTAKQAVSTAISTSKSAAIASLREDSVKLANILINQVLDAGYDYTDDDIATVNAAIASLEAIYGNLENALKQAIIAVGVAQGHTITAENITISGGTFTVANDPLNWDSLTAMQATILAGCATLKDMDTDLTNAATAMTTSNVATALTSLLSSGDFEVIDSSTGTVYPVSQLQSMAADPAQMVTVAKIMMGTPTISIKSGIYYDIALFSGNYSATATMNVTLEYSGIKLENEPISVVMATNTPEQEITTGVKGYYLPLVLNQLSNVNVTGDGTGTNKVITDIYGYAIDLAFRTNAAGSSLLLQTEAANRVEDSEQTQGAGSFMQFTSANDDFTLLQVINLMNSIRVVFIDDNGSVYGVAAMNVSYTEVADDATEFDLTVDGKKYTLTGCTTVEVDGKTYIKAALNLYGFSIDSNGKMTLGTQLASNTLTELQQNTALGITSLVYLDGDTVTNADVAINGNSMTGTMNLQFASDAELDPMDYTFPEQETLGKPSITLEGNNLTITAVNGATSYEFYVAGRATGVTTTVTGTAIDLSNALSSVDDAVAGQQIAITVVAKADGVTSDQSNSVTWTVPEN